MQCTNSEYWSLYLAVCHVTFTSVLESDGSGSIKVQLSIFNSLTLKHLFDCIYAFQCVLWQRCVEYTKTVLK